MTTSDFIINDSDSEVDSEDEVISKCEFMVSNISVSVLITSFNTFSVARSFCKGVTKTRAQ